MWIEAAVGFAAGLLIAVVTAPVGVSGAVFLLPFQLSVLSVPSPAVTPTNLMYNVIAVPGALARYRQRASLRSSLTTQLITGTLPGVVVGALIRVFVVPDGTVFRALVALLLLSLGVWLLVRDRISRAKSPRGGVTSGSQLVVLGFIAGLIGGIYGIGGGSLLAPVLVVSGYVVAEVAPAALVSTFITSCAGVMTYGALAIAGHHEASPDWIIAGACGVGGLVGGYIGAAIQPRLPARLLTAALGAIAVALSLAYLIAAFSAAT